MSDWRDGFYPPSPDEALAAMRAESLRLAQATGNYERASELAVWADVLDSALDELADAALQASLAMADAADADFMGDHYHESIARLRAAIAKVQS